MKKINKYFAVFSALLLTVTSLLSVAPAFADEATTNTVTLHKILQTESNLIKVTSQELQALTEMTIKVNLFLTLLNTLDQVLKKLTVLSLLWL
ncbi:TPA: hypothetical protein ACG3WX_000711 [Streptococcus agalactiae]